VLTLPRAAHTLEPHDPRSTRLAAAGALLGAKLGEDLVGCSVVRVVFAWIMTLVGDMTILPRTAEALLAQIGDVDDAEEGAWLRTLAALALAAAGQRDRAQQALVTAHTAITDYADHTEKAILLAAAAWAGSLIAE
jgi:hypothetical protein